MRYMVERNFVTVLGYIWMPNNVLCSYRYPLSRHDVENIGEFTRDNVEQWLACHAGDFKHIVDFWASVGDKEIPFESEEHEMQYLDTLPEE